MKRIWTILAVLLLMMAVAGADAVDNLTEAWILCQPDSEVNLRASPSKSGRVEGRLFAGDLVLLDGKKHGDWVHAVGIPCEAGEGWINRGYVTEYYAELVEDYRCTVNRKQVNARYCIGGKLRRKLRKGAEVSVYVMSGEWAVTSAGFVKTEFLEPKEEETDDL